MVKLSHPTNYKELEDCNGCGSGWSAKLIPNSIYWVNIRPACCIHDNRYKNGKTAEDKASADREFLNNMLRLIEAKKAWYYPHFLARGRAIKYYTAVVNFGGPAFFKGK